MLEVAASLLSKLEQAPEGSRELDISILVWVESSKHPEATYVDEDHNTWYADIYEDGEPASFVRAMDSAPHYTTSLDAKLPGENIWNVDKRSDDWWVATHYDEKGNHHKGYGHTEALARRGAALKASLKARE